MEKQTTPVEKKLFGLLQEAERRRCKEDLYYFANFILGAAYLKDGKSRADWHHKELCQLLMDQWRNRFDKPTKTTVSVQWPRGSLKSTYCTVAFPIWVLLNEPTTRILIESEVATNAQRFLLNIKNSIESKYFKFLFGQIYNPKHRWNTENLTINREIEFREPSIDIGGVEVEKVGQHYDLIIGDDIQGKTNSQTRDQIEKVINHVRAGYSLLNPQGMYLHPQTRWAFGDLGGYFEELNEIAEKELRPYPIVINKYTCWKHDKQGRELVGEPEFPKLLPVEELADVRAKQGAYMFSCNYLLSPQSDETAVFKADWVQYHDRPQEDFNNSSIFITVDPAGEGNHDKADFTAICVAAIDRKFDIYVLEMIRGHFTNRDIADRLFALTERYRPEAVGLEDVFAQKELFVWLRKEAEISRRALPLRRLKTSNKMKVNRIKALQAPMEAKKIFIRREFTHLFDEIVRFPKGQHDDCLDALAYQMEFMHLPPEQQPKEFWDNGDAKWRKNWDKPERPPSALEVKVWKFEKRQAERKMGRSFSFRGG